MNPLAVAFDILGWQDRVKSRRSGGSAFSFRNDLFLICMPLLVVAVGDVGILFMRSSFAGIPQIVPVWLVAFS